MASPSVPLSRGTRKSPCFGCKEKRCRCDQGFPSCGKCQELGRECVYPVVDAVTPTIIKLRVPVNTVNTVESDGGRPARRAALSAKETLFAESKSAKVEKKELRTSVAHLSVGEQVLLRIRANRYKRAYASSDGNDPRNAKRKQRASDFPDDEPTCFLCLQPLPKGTAAINQHIDLCLARAESTNPTSTPLSSASKKGKSRAAQPPPPPPPPLTEEYYDEPELETYEWAGQTRVRVTSMLEGGLAAHYGGTVYNKARDQDVDEDVDIDEDETEVFGGVQYTDADVKRFDQGDGEGEEGGVGGDGGVGEGNDGGVGQVKEEEEEEVDIDEVDMSKGTSSHVNRSTATTY
ncbi:hypothetical protein HDU99_001572 [Rhizoclosmatium hyalinum]|nr:hypothetical protein HDU99_001572 [Rhizoclosmatium hyalinum]